MTPRLIRMSGLGATCAGLMLLASFAANAEPEKKATAQAQGALPEKAFASAQKALSVYEQVRQELAADRLEPVAPHCLRLVGALRLAMADLPDSADAELRRILKEGAKAAEDLGDAKDLKTARIAFGEVSHRLMLLVKRDPRLGEGLNAFVCPMAEKFQKWVQPKEEIENPYMGPGMLRCGVATDWSVPELASLVEKNGKAPRAQAEQTPKESEPEFKPGIRGLKMVDVRDHKFLWREIDELQVWERSERITAAEFRSKAIEKTAHFLELPKSSARRFTTTAHKAVADIRAAFKKHRQPGLAPGGPKFTADVDKSVARMKARLGDKPRHQLFAPSIKRWLMKLAFGPREKKEAREARADASSRKNKKK